MAKTYYDSGRPIKVKGPGEFTGISEKALKEEAKKQRLAKTKARVKAKKSLKTFKVDPKTMPKAKTGKGVNKLGAVNPATQTISPSAGNPVKSKSGAVPKGTKQTSFLKTVATDPRPARQTVHLKKGSAVQSPKPATPGMSKKTAEKFATKKSIQYTVSSLPKNLQAKTAAKLLGKAASRLIPGVGTAMIAKDVYDFTKWAAKQPKKSTKPYKYGSNY